MLLLVKKLTFLEQVWFSGDDYSSSATSFWQKKQDENSITTVFKRRLSRFKRYFKETIFIIYRLLMKRIGSMEALFNVISDRSGCTQSQIFGYILGGISWKMVFALAYTPFWKLNKYAINLAKKYNDISLVELAFYTHSLKTLCKKTKN